MSGSTPRKHNNRGGQHHQNHNNNHNNHNQHQQQQHRRNRSSAQYQQQHLTSDYESEDPTAAAAAAAAYYPPATQDHLASRTNTELNLSVLRRYLPAVSGILSVVHNARPHVLEFTYSNGASSSSPDAAHHHQHHNHMADPEPRTSWRLLDAYEGPMFVCRQEVPGDEYVVLIMNRKGIQNFVLHLASASHFDPSSEFLMFKMDENPPPGPHPSVLPGSGVEETAPATAAGVTGTGTGGVGAGIQQPTDVTAGQIIGLWTFFDDAQERQRTAALIHELWRELHEGGAAAAAAAVAGGM